MKPYLRHERVDDLIRQELAKIVAKEMEFAPGVLVTITEVIVGKKLDRCQVLVSAIPSSGNDEAVRLLNSRRPFLQHLLLKKIQIHPLPDLEFIVDVGQEKAAAIEKALLENRAKDGNNS